ncbi:MAG: oligosaccharide flippase family protein [Bacteroidota bacterium]
MSGFERENREDSPDVPRPSSVHEEVRRGALVNALGVVGKIAGPSFLLVVTRLYGADVFGVFITASALIEMSIALLTAGFKDAILIFVARHADEKAPGPNRPLYAAIANAFAWSLGLAAFLVTAALLVGPVALPRLFDYGEALALAVSIMALALPFMAFDRIVIAATQGLKIMKYEALINGGARPLMLLVLALVVYPLSGDVLGLTLAYLATQICMAAVAIGIYRREFAWRPLWGAFRSFRVNREMVRFAIPQNLNLTLDRFLTNMDVLMLGAFGVSAQWVGFYGAGALIVRELRHIKLVFSSAFAPHIVRLHHQGRIDELARSLASTARWVSTLLVPALLGVAVLRGDLLSLVVPDFEGQETLFMLALLPVPYFQGSFGLAGNAVVMTGNSHLNLFNNLVAGGGNFALNLWLIPVFGPLGAAIASSTAAAVKAVLEVTELRVVVGVPLYVRSWFQPHVAGTIAAVILVLVTQTGWPALALQNRLLLVAGLVGIALGLTYALLPFAASPSETVSEEPAQRKA